MKRMLFVPALVFAIAISGFSQEINVYSLIVNIVQDNFRFPLIGVANIAKGNHNNVQLGVINWNIKDFSTLQLGCINTVGGDLSGVQLGYINTSVGNVNGWQIGCVNTTKSFNGTQIGIINIAMNGGQGLQLGFVNTSVQRLQGVQIGVINYVDSIENGIPIGLISIVRNGGYKAVEYSFSEFHPLNIGLKLGVESFYTSIFASYNPFEENIQDSFATGLGFGSIIPVNSMFFINPELNGLNIIGGNSPLALSFVPNIGFNINHNLSLTIAPALTWVLYFTDNKLLAPFFSIFQHDINENNSIIIGTRASIRFRF
jgi:hypothetical protein